MGENANRVLFDLNLLHGGKQGALLAGLVAAAESRVLGRVVIGAHSCVLDVYLVKVTGHLMLAVTVVVQVPPTETR